MALLGMAKSNPTDGTLLLISILATTGIRAEELSHLIGKDLDPETGGITVYAAKDSHDRTLYVPAWLCSAILSHPNLQNDLGRALFCLIEPHYDGYLHSNRLRHNAKQRLRHYWRLLRPKLSASDISMHGLRHSVAIRMLEKTKDITKVQSVLGHKNINNTMFYLKYVDSMEASKELADFFR